MLEDGCVRMRQKEEQDGGATRDVPDVVVRRQSVRVGGEQPRG